MLTNSIVRRHNHANALNFIGLSFDGTTFPAVLNCPFCGANSLYAFDYTAKEDIWFNCTSCQSHGNIITLAAQIWKTDIPDAIDRLVSSGLTQGGNSSDISDIMRINSQQVAARLLWEKAVDQTWTLADDSILHRYREWGISREIPCTGMVGVADAKQIADYCSAVRHAWPKYMRTTVPMIVLPYYDLPNHFTGFLLIQTGREMETKQAFLPVYIARNTRSDAGYFMIDNALLPPSAAVKDALFVVDDPLWAIQAQTIQMRHDAPLLPICASHADKDCLSHGTSLHNFKQSKKLFYGNAVTPEIVSQAANARGYVCVPGPEGTLINPSPLKTSRRLAAIYRSAVTWQTALEKAMKEREPTAAVSFAAQLQINRDKLQQFLRTRIELRENEIVDIINRSAPPSSGLGKVAAFTDIIERDEGWYTPSGICITTCAPRITQIVYTDDGRKYYAGYAKKNGVMVEFFANVEVIDKVGLLTYCEQLLAAKGVLVISLAKWNRRASTICLKLHPPEVITVTDKLGWDDDAREFRFSTYSIANDGTIIPAKCPQLQKTKKFDFPEPTTAAPPAIKAFLTPTHENAFVWAFVAAVLNNFIAPIMNMPHTGAAILADGYSSALECGKALNCDIRELAANTQSANHSFGWLLRALTNVTLFTPAGQTDTTVKTLLFKGNKYPVFAPLQRRSIPAALTFDWAAIVPTAVPAADIDYSPLKFIVPTYIQRILRQRVGVSAYGPQMILATLQDLHRWLEITYGHTFNLPAAEACVILPDAMLDVFMQELNTAIVTGELDILPRHRLPKQPQNYIMRTGEHWWLNKRAIDAYFAKTGVAVNWTALLNYFTQRRVFCGQEKTSSTVWFLIEKSWCDKFWSDYEEKSA